MDSRMVHWMDAARVAVEFSTRLQPKEKALVVTDTVVADYPSWSDFGDAIFAAARYVGADVSRIEFQALSTPNEELPPVVAAAMAASDVIYLGPTMAAFHTMATRNALLGGARLLGISAPDSASNIAGFGRGLRLAPRTIDEAQEWAALITRLAVLFRGGGTLHVTTPKGTDVTCDVGKLEIHTMDSLYVRPGTYTHFVPGQSGGGTTPGLTQGTLVVDASITPIRRPLTNEPPVVLHIKDGYIVGVDGGPAAAEWKARADALGDPTVYHVAEYGFGCHPRSRTPGGWPLEDERMYGSFHLGIGTNTSFGGDVQSKWHIDATCCLATATLNGALIVQDGEFTV